MIMQVRTGQARVVHDQASLREAMWIQVNHLHEVKEFVVDRAKQGGVCRVRKCVPT